MKETTTQKPKKGNIAKIVIALTALTVVAAIAYGTVMVLHGDPDPSQWSGQRTNYKNTK